MATDWRRMTVQQLKAELKKLGLEDTGRKSDLVDRLTEYANKDATEEQKPPVTTKSIFDEPPESDSECESEDQAPSTDVNSKSNSASEKEKSNPIKKKTEAVSEVVESEPPEKSKQVTEKGKSLSIIEKGKSDEVVKKQQSNQTTGKDVSAVEKKSELPVKNEKPGTVTGKMSKSNGEKSDSSSDHKQKHAQMMESQDTPSFKQNQDEIETGTSVVKSAGDKEPGAKTKNEEIANKQATSNVKNKDVKDTIRFGDNSDQPKKWIDIMDCANSEKIIQELEKLGKVEPFKNRQKEHDQVGKQHKIRIFPLTIEDMATPFLQDIASKAKIFVVKYGVVEKGSKLGWLMAVFRTRSEVVQAVADIKKAREDLKVLYETGEKTVPEKGSSWHVQWAKIVNKPDPGDVNIFRLFMPSLPQAITEEEMWDIFPTARDIILVDAKPRKHAYIHFWNEKSARAALDELNAQGPPRDDLQFCRLLPQGELHKLLMTKTSSGTDKNVQKREESSQQSGKPAKETDRPQFQENPKPLIDTKGKPKNLMNIQLGQPVKSGRRMHKRKGSRGIRAAPYSATSYQQGDGPTGKLQNTFAQLQTQSFKMGSQMTNTNVWPQMTPDAGPSMSPVGPQPMIDNHPGPKPLMEAIPDQPPFDIAPLQSSRGRDFGKVKRPHSPVAGYPFNKRSRERCGPWSSHSFSPRGSGESGCMDSGMIPDDFDCPGGSMSGGFNSQAGLIDDFHCPPNESHDYGHFGDFGSRNNRTNFGASGPSYRSSYNSGDDGESYQRHQLYDDDDESYHRCLSSSDNHYGRLSSSFTANVKPFNSPSWSQPDQDYREPEPYMNRSMSSLNTCTKSFVDDPLPMDQPRYPRGEGRSYRTSTYY